MTGENKPRRVFTRENATKVAPIIAISVGFPAVWAAGVLLTEEEAPPAYEVISSLYGMALCTMLGCLAALVATWFAFSRDSRDSQGADEPTTTPRDYDYDYDCDCDCDCDYEYEYDPVADFISNLKAIAVGATALFAPTTYIILVAINYPPAGVSTGEIRVYLFGAAVFTVLGFLAALALAHRLFREAEVERVTPEERAAKERAAKERAAVAVAKRLAARKGVSS